MLDDFGLYVSYRISYFRPNWLCFRLRLGKAQPVTETCQVCGGPLGFLFSGTYCKNQHCDLPADKKAAAKKKDEEIRASAKPNPTPGSVATPVSTPVQALCYGLCGKPPNYVNDGWGNYYCDNQCTVFGTRGVCGARRPPVNLAAFGKAASSNSWNLSGFPTFTINWGGHTLNVVSDPYCPPDKPYFHPTRDLVFAHPALIALKKPYPDLGRAPRSQFQYDGVVPGPEVRADSGPPREDWRHNYPESHSSAHDGYADWHEAGNREELEHYNR